MVSHTFKSSILSMMEKNAMPGKDETDYNIIHY